MLGNNKGEFHGSVVGCAAVCYRKLYDVVRARAVVLVLCDIALVNSLVVDSAVLCDNAVVCAFVIVVVVVECVLVNIGDSESYTLKFFIRDDVISVVEHIGVVVV